jgi:aromatic ring hydroxylase
MDVSLLFEFPWNFVFIVFDGRNCGNCMFAVTSLSFHAFQVCLRKSIEYHKKV